jgi:hypothetical protein
LRRRVSPEARGGVVTIGDQPTMTAHRTKTGDQT